MNLDKNPRKEAKHVRLDKSRRFLIIDDPDKAPHQRTDACIVLDIMYMTDVRTWVNHDEDQIQPVSEGYQPKYFQIARYPKYRDFINVTLENFLCEQKATATLWRKGMHNLIKHLSPSNTTRYVSPLEILEHEFARCGTRADPHDGTVTVLDLVEVIAFEDSVKDSSVVENVINFLQTENFKSVKTKSSKISLVCANPNGRGLDLHQWERLNFQVHPRDDLDSIFKENAINPMVMTPQELVSFFMVTQLDDRNSDEAANNVSEQEAVDLIKQYDPSETGQGGNLTINGFRRMMLSEYLDLCEPMHRTVYQNMYHPLPHYFVSCSHNSYLTGHQLTGKSTYEIYRQQLLFGVRCVEIDAWDGDAKWNFRGINTHGHTVCTKISFDGTMQAIADFSFCNSQYPVSLSFENHLTEVQMRAAAADCVQIFGDLLQKEFLPGDGPDYDNRTFGKKLCPPEKLKGKICIKNKRSKAENKLLSDLGKSSSGNKEDELDGEQAAEWVAAMLEETAAELEHRKQRSNKMIVSELSALVNYFWPTHFKGFEKARKLGFPFQMSSFAESKANKFVAKAPVDFVDYNKRQFARIYPNGGRVASTNFNPHLYWNAGCQLVALNYQTDGVPLQMSIGKYEMNGRCGWNLKPNVYRLDEEGQFNPFNVEVLENVEALNVSIKVISGRYLGPKGMQPQVSIEMHGLPSDTHKDFSTRPFRGKGMLAEWKSDNEVLFRRVTLAEQCILLFKVTNANKESLGRCCIPLQMMRCGFRTVMLDRGMSELSQLLIQFKAEIFQSTEHADLIDKLVNPVQFSSAEESNMAAMDALLHNEDDEENANVGNIADALSPEMLAQKKKDEEERLFRKEQNDAVQGFLTVTDILKSDNDQTRSWKNTLMSLDEEARRSYMQELDRLDLIYGQLDQDCADETIDEMVGKDPTWKPGVSPLQKNVVVPAILDDVRVAGYKKQIKLLIDHCQEFKKVCTNYLKSSKTQRVTLINKTETLYKEELVEKHAKQLQDKRTELEDEVDVKLKELEKSSKNKKELKKQKAEEVQVHAKKIARSLQKLKDHQKNEMKVLVKEYKETLKHMMKGYSCILAELEKNFQGLISVVFRSMESHPDSPHNIYDISISDYFHAMKDVAFCDSMSWTKINSL